MPTLYDTLSPVAVVAWVADAADALAAGLLESYGPLDMPESVMEAVNAARQIAEVARRCLAARLAAAADRAFRRSGNV